MKSKNTIRISKSPSVLYIWLCIAVADGLLEIFSVNLYTCRTILTFLIIFTSALDLLYSRRKINIDKSVYIIVGILFIIPFYGLMRGINNYNYNAVETFFAFRIYIWVLFTIPLLRNLLYKNRKKYIIDAIIYTTLFVLLLKFVIALTYNITGHELFVDMLYEYANRGWIRSGRIRIDLKPLTHVVTVIIWYRYLLTKEKKYFFETAFVVLYILYVYQARASLLVVLSTILIMTLFEKRRKTSRLIVGIILIFGLFLFLTFGGLKAILNAIGIDLSSKSLFINPSEYRYWEINYYLDLLSQNWKLGLGILSPRNAASARVLYGTAKDASYISDFGFLSIFLQMGVLGLLMYFVLYFYMIKTLIRCIKGKEYDLTILIFGLFFITVSYSLLVDLFQDDSIFSLPIMLAILGYINDRVSNKTYNKIMI